MIDRKCDTGCAPLIFFFQLKVILAQGTLKYDSHIIEFIQIPPNHKHNHIT